jgi:hypothetical protein
MKHQFHHHFSKMKILENYLEMVYEESKILKKQKNTKNQ